ncbi:hypothetical protein PR048_029166 [Dryococelus australis]|uniref:Uncharacterized protein n=1 Tax=Dryococelus australis TaxID=614101 RepID=A0ABQ9GCL3_9NEOP|nr:hypothetical protein PR048_029166 [Dryococelus australis]
MDNEEEVFVSSLLSDEEDRIRKRKRNVLAHNINSKRTKYGEYHTLCPDLVEDDMRFFQYFLTTEAKFKALLDILREELGKQQSSGS